MKVAKKAQLEECIKKEKCKLEYLREYPGVYHDAMREDITKRIDALNDELATRQESIDPLKGRLKNQITSFRETIAKVLDSNTSLAEELRDHHGVYDDGILKDIMKPIAKLNDELKARQESINLLKGRLTNQSTSFKEMILKYWIKTPH